MSAQRTMKHSVWAKTMCLVVSTPSLFHWDLPLVVEKAYGSLWTVRINRDIVPQEDFRLESEKYPKKETVVACCGRVAADL